VSKRRASPGFTLIELIVAMVLSSVVLMGLFSIMTNMVQAEVNGMRQGTVTAWSLAGISAMNSDIAGASYIAYPGAGNAGADALVVCTNWSPNALPGPTAGPIPGGPAGNDVYTYCYDTTDAPPFGNSILRKHVFNGAAACPGAAPAGCTSGNYPGDSIVATGVYRDTNSDNLFSNDPNTLNAVRIRYTVGNPAASAVSAGGNGGTVTAVPVTVPFNTEIILED
jgi:prepilin-type N-terminal cleavage/methylation domain-containing protein